MLLKYTLLFCILKTAFVSYVVVVLQERKKKFHVLDNERQIEQSWQECDLKVDVNKEKKKEKE